MIERCKNMSNSKKESDHRRNYEGLNTLTYEIRQITKPILGKRGFAGVDVITYWEDIVGFDLSRGIRPEKLVFEKDSRINGTLYVKAAGGAFAMLLEHQKERVIQRVNVFFGYPAVSRIKVRQGALFLKTPSIEATKPSLSPQKLKQLQERLKNIEDPNLKTVLFNIGKAIQEKQPKENE